MIPIVDEYAIDYKRVTEVASDATAPASVVGRKDTAFYTRVAIHITAYSPAAPTSYVVGNYAIFNVW